VEDTACCARFLRGEAVAPTAEALMRSRYTAYAVGDAAYLLATWHPTSRPRRLDLDVDLRWAGLTVLESRGGLFDTDGVVTFEARYDDGGRTGVLRETSRFVREGGRWFYVAPV
jgi:SEC-C motif-containing protein